MKNIYLLILMTAAFTISQAQKTKNFSWGYKVGINASNLRIENANNGDWKTGLATGLFFNVKLADKLSLQPELLYSSMGARNMEGGGTSLRLNYFSLPVVAKYSVCRNVSVLGGPQIDMLIQAKTKSSNNSFTKITNEFKEHSFNLTGGMEYWPVKCLSFSGRYIYGLTNIALSGAELKNQAIQFSAAVQF